VNPLSGKGNGKAKGVHMRLFTDFYHSDIILASPLGLRLILESSASTSSGSGSNENKKGTKVENDYLSSLEIIYFHQADVLLMQNWSHVEYILQHCNQLPHNKTHASASIDFTRIRPYFLDNLSKQHRQIILSSHFHDPNFNSLIRQECQSKSGIVKLKKNSLNGCLSSIITQVKQIFNIIPVTSFLNEEQERFQYFNSNVLTPLLRLKQSHTLIVTPSYLHFVQVRNELIRREVSPQIQSPPFTLSSFHILDFLFLFLGSRRMWLSSVSTVVRVKSLVEEVNFFTGPKRSCCTLAELTSSGEDLSMPT
jgi:hypothetical protein